MFRQPSFQHMVYCGLAHDILPRWGLNCQHLTFPTWGDANSRDGSMASSNIHGASPRSLGVCGSRTYWSIFLSLLHLHSDSYWHSHFSEKRQFPTGVCYVRKGFSLTYSLLRPRQMKNDLSYLRKINLTLTLFQVSENTNLSFDSWNIFEPIFAFF